VRSNGSPMCNSLGYLGDATSQSLEKIAHLKHTKDKRSAQWPEDEH
jgi:hypothetical protein